MLGDERQHTRQGTDTPPPGERTSLVHRGQFTRLGDGTVTPTLGTAHTSPSEQGHVPFVWAAGEGPSGPRDPNL